MVGVMVEQVYRAAWRAALPVVSWYVKRKDKRRLLPAAITTERFGYSRVPGTQPLQQPNRIPSLIPCIEAHWQDHSAAFTLWIHGASVGECLSAIPLIDLFTSDRDRIPGAEKRVLLTTTTVAARQLLNSRIAHVRSIMELRGISIVCLKHRIIPVYCCMYSSIACASWLHWTTPSASRASWTPGSQSKPTHGVRHDPVFARISCH